MHEDVGFIDGKIDIITTYRVRVAHVHTLKDGWRLSETTVEANGSDIDYDAIEMHTRAAYEVGVEEAKRRNRLQHDYNRGVLAGSEQ